MVVPGEGVATTILALPPQACRRRIFFAMISGKCSTGSRSCGHVLSTFIRLMLTEINPVVPAWKVVKFDKDQTLGSLPQVMDAGNGQVALYNLYRKQYIRLNGHVAWKQLETEATTIEHLMNHTVLNPYAAIYAPSLTSLRD